MSTITWVWIGHAAALTLMLTSAVLSWRAMVAQRQRHTLRELRLQRALGFYARESNWQRYTETLSDGRKTWSNSLISVDRGRTARETLAEHHGITVEELVARGLARGTKILPGGSGPSPADTRPTRPAGPSPEPAP